MLFRSVSEKHKKMAEDEVWSIFIQLCEALRYLHVDKHVVHRDIAPVNVMINNEGIVKLMDFGLAKAWEQQNGMLKSFAGTVVYTCPEIVQNMPYTSKADVWSLGCVIYELMNLKPAFCAMNPLTLAKKIVEEDYESLDDKGYSPHLVSVVKACMTANSEKRPNIEELACLMGPKLMTYIDKMRISEEALDQSCNLLKSQIERHEALKTPALREDCNLFSCLSVCRPLPATTMSIRTPLIKSLWPYNLPQPYATAQE